MSTYKVLPAVGHTIDKIVSEFNQIKAELKKKVVPINIKS